MKIIIDENLYTRYSDIMKDYNISYYKLKTILSEKGNNLKKEDLINLSIYKICQDNNVNYQKVLRRIHNSTTKNIEDAINSVRSINEQVYSIGNIQCSSEEEMYSILGVKKNSIYRYALRHNITFNDALNHYKQKYENMRTLL